MKKTLLPLIALMFFSIFSIVPAQEQPVTPTTLGKASSAFLVFKVKIKDSNKWQEYVSQASKTIGEFGGELILRGAFEKVLSGDSITHQLGGVIRFPNLDAIDKWYTSDVYSPLMPLREEAAEVTQTIYTVTD